MITLTGGYGKGTLWGTAYMSDRETSGQGSIPLNGHLDTCLPPSDWYLPPPDSVWYSTVDSAYGPRLVKVVVGDIQSHDNPDIEFKPCRHTTMKGDALYRGPNDANAPYWRKMASNCVTTYQAATQSDFQPSPIKSHLTVMRGRPCTTTDKKVYDRYGVLINQVLTNANGGSRYWFDDSDICVNNAPKGIQSALAQLGTPYVNSRWYCLGYNGSLATLPWSETRWIKTLWRRPNRTTFVREQWSEYHTTQSYTPESSVGYSGHPFTREANHRVSTFNIVGIRSDKPGRFQLMYEQKTELSWYGWKPYAPFSGSKTVSTSGLITALLIMEPGLTAENILDVSKANIYCNDAIEIASLLYDHSAASSARTAAVNDVQELESNWIENLAGVKGAVECVKPLIDGYKAVKNGDLRSAKKALAGGYLVYKYVVAPSISDAKDLKKHGSTMFHAATDKRFSRERRRGASHLKDVPVFSTLATLDFFTTLHLKLRNNPFSSVWNGLESLGLDPSAGQLWDLVPFSFVADWFLPIGDSLTTISNYSSLLLNRDVDARIETFNAQWPLEEEVITYLFDGYVSSGASPLKYSWYDRRIYHDVGSVDLIAISNDNGLSVSQMTQGAALLTQMR